jgi:hypothetical protein
MLLRIVPLLLAAALLAAHYFRLAQHALVALSLAAPLLLLLRRRGSLWLLQLGAYAASLVWLASLLELVQYRQQMGRPWTAAALILGSVMALTLLAGLLLNTRAVRERYPR